MERTKCTNILPSLKEVMLKRNLSDKELVDLLGVSYGTINNAKQGRHIPNKKSRNILEERLGKINWGFKKCACGCGTLISKTSTWAQGHQHYGVNGYGKLDKYNWKGYGKNRNSYYPSVEQIIGAHSNFINKNNINPNLCWMCQQTHWDQKAHIIAASQKGSNHPDNLLLLCGNCHIIQGISDLIQEWTKESQYLWLEKHKQEHRKGFIYFSKIVKMDFIESDKMITSQMKECIL